MQQPDPTALIDGATALGVTLDEDKATLLLAYVALLSKWNRVYNLTAVRKPSEMLVHHLLDSIAIVAPLRRWTGGLLSHGLSRGPLRLLDVGSGAGLPGVILAALMPELQVSCVDAVGKKAAFVRQVAGELRIANLHAIHARVEALADDPFDVITSRAFASLADFTALTWRLRGESTVWLAMKAKAPTDEAVELPPAIDMFHVEPLAVPGLAGERCLVWMRERQ